MAVNLASKYLKAIDQVFALGSLTKSGFAGKFDFTGVNAVKVYTLTTQALGDYTRTGSDRYGTPTEVQDTVATYTLSKDRSFSATIDKGNYIQGNLVKTTGAFVKAEMDEQIIPEMDTHAMTVLTATAVAASKDIVTVVTASNAYETLLDAGVSLDNDKVPKKGRVCFVTPTYFKFLRLDTDFVKPSEMAQKMMINGQVGEADGAAIVVLPTSYFPANTNFILTHPKANVYPRQLEELKIHDNPPGISGALIEGRYIYDAFSFAQKIEVNLYRRHR
jgi:hypothetical protein